MYWLAGVLLTFLITVLLFVAVPKTLGMNVTSMTIEMMMASTKLSVLQVLLLWHYLQAAAVAVVSCTFFASRLSQPRPFHGGELFLSQDQATCSAARERPRRDPKDRHLQPEQRSKAKEVIKRMTERGVCRHD